MRSQPGDRAPRRSRPDAPPAPRPGAGWSPRRWGAGGRETGAHDGLGLHEVAHGEQDLGQDDGSRTAACRPDAATTRTASRACSRSRRRSPLAYEIVSLCQYASPMATGLARGQRLLPAGRRVQVRLLQVGVQHEHGTGALRAADRGGGARAMGGRHCVASSTCRASSVRPPRTRCSRRQARASACSRLSGSTRESSTARSMVGESDDPGSRRVERDLSPPARVSLLPRAGRVRARRGRARRSSSR